jgi:hypothetical protein
LKHPERMEREVRIRHHPPKDLSVSKPLAVLYNMQRIEQVTFAKPPPSKSKIWSQELK